MRLGKVVSVVVTVALLAGSMLAVPGTAIAADTGSITGKVTSNGTDGIESITVDVFNELYSIGDWVQWNWLTSVQTAADGSYDTGFLAPGTYRLRFRDTTGTYANEFHSDKVNLDGADDIVVTAGEPVEVDAQLAEAGHVTGTVTSNGVDGIEGVTVTAHRYEMVGGEWLWMAQPAVYTDSAGDYDVGALTTGNYRIEFAPAGGDYLPEFYSDKAEVLDADDVAVTVGQTTSGIDAELQTASSISGRVTSNGTDGIEDVRVTAYKARIDGSETYWDHTRSTYSEADGSYRVDGLESGTYRLKFEDQGGSYITEWHLDGLDLESATDIEVPVATDVPDLDAVMEQAGQITGTVTSDGTSGIDGVIVWVYRLDEGGPNPEWVYADSDDSGSDGTYEVSGLRPGTYRVEFADIWGGNFLGEYFNDKQTLEEADDVDVMGGAATKDIDAVLAPAAKIGGTVTNGSQPLAGITVVASIQTESGTRSHGVQTNGRGQYLVGGLEPGAYKVRFKDDSNTYLTEYYDNKPDMASANTVTAVAGSTATANAVLAKPAAPVTTGSVAGKVIASYGGAAIEGAKVTLSRIGRTAWTGSGGTYSFAGVAPGTYAATFVKTGYKTKTASVSVVAGRSSGANVALVRNVGKASVARTPNKSKVTYKRKAGVAKFKLAATMKGWGGKALSKRTVYLQTSKDGKKWKSTYKLKTASTGKVSKSFKIKSKQVRYYRWYVPAKSQVNLKTYSAKTKVTVK